MERVATFEVGRVTEHEHVEKNADAEGQGKRQSHEQAGHLSGFLCAHVGVVFLVKERPLVVFVFSFVLPATVFHLRGGVGKLSTIRLFVQP
jgi:hypothetical protein